MIEQARDMRKALLPVQMLPGGWQPVFNSTEGSRPYHAELPKSHPHSCKNK